MAAASLSGADLVHDGGRHVADDGPPLGEEIRLFELRDRLDRLKKVVDSEWLDFGELDPVSDAEKTSFACATCGGHPDIIETTMPDSDHGEAGRPAFAVKCHKCDVQGYPQVMVWRAVIAWNKSSKSIKPSRQDFPFFMLQGMSDEEAYIRLTLLHDVVITRNRINGLDIRMGRRVGNDFRQRMLAYDAWAHLLWLSLFRGNPELTPGEYQAALKRATRIELRRLRGIMLGYAPVESDSRTSMPLTDAPTQECTPSDESDQVPQQEPDAIPPGEDRPPADAGNKDYPWLRRNCRSVFILATCTVMWVPKYVYRVDSGLNSGGWSIRVPGMPTSFISDRSVSSKRPSPKKALAQAVEKLKAIYI